jgi:hypothetical protein
MAISGSQEALHRAIPDLYGVRKGRSLGILIVGISKDDSDNTEGSPDEYRLEIRRDGRITINLPALPSKFPWQPNRTPSQILRSPIA